MSSHLPAPRTQEFEQVFRATPASMLMVTELLDKALLELANTGTGVEKTELYARATRLVKGMNTAAHAKLNDLIEQEQVRKSNKLNILNPETLPALLEDGTCAKSFYESKGIRVLDGCENGAGFYVDLPLLWRVNYFAVTGKWVLMDSSKKRVGSFKKPLQTFDL